MKIVPTSRDAAPHMLRRTAACEELALQAARQNPPPHDPTVQDPRDADDGDDARIRAVASASLFSVNRVTGETLLIPKVEPSGEPPGLERLSYETVADFSAATKRIVNHPSAKPDNGDPIDTIATRLKLDSETIALLKQQKTPDLLFRLLENHLKLDHLGISLTGLVTAVQDMRTGNVEGIIKVLERDLGLPREQDGKGSVSITTDEAGLYRVTPGLGA